MKRRLGALLVAFGLFGALLLFLLGKGCGSVAPASTDATSFVEEPGSHDGSTMLAVGSDPSAETRLAAQDRGHDALAIRLPQTEHRTTECEVRDKSSDAPLAATVRMGIEEWTCAQDGTALIPYEAGRVFVVRCKGYEEQRVEFPPSFQDVLQVRLTPARSCTIEVVNELGMLQPGAEIRWVRPFSNEEEALPIGSWSRTVARTQADGHARLRIAKLGWVFAVLEGRCSGLVPLQPSDAPVVITLATMRATQVALRGPDGAPVQAMHVRAREGASLGLPAIDLASDGEGRLTGPIPIGAYILDIPWMTATLSASAAAQQSSLARDAFNLSLPAARVRITPDDHTEWLEVRPSSELLVEVRDPSGTPLQPLEVWEEFLQDSDHGDRQWWRLQSPGSVRVPSNRCSLSMFGRPKRLGAPDYRVVVASAGYMPVLLNSPFAPGPDGVCHLTLEPQTGAHSLRVVDASGAPHRGRIRIREVARSWNLFDGMPDPRDGSVGPFLFAGPGALEVLRSSGSLFQVVTQVPFEALKRDPQTVVVVDGTASIRIVGAAAERDLWQVIGADRRIWCGEPEGSDLLISGLWPGRYVLADSIRLRLVLNLVSDLSTGMTRRTPAEILPIDLRDGEELRVEKPALMSEQSVSGRVDLPLDLDGPLFVYVLGADSSLPRRAGARDLRCPLSSFGSYSLERLPFAPASLVLVHIDDAGWILPLVSFAPGETPRPSGARVLLRLSGLTESLCTGTVDWAGTSYFARCLTTGSERVDLGWFPLGKLRIRILDSEERYMETLIQVPGEGMTTLERAADAEARASWQHAQAPTEFNR